MKKIIPIILIILTVFSVFSVFPVSAAEVDSFNIGNLDETSVDKDLIFYGDLYEKFPVNLKDDNVYLINFSEYGYTESLKQYSPDYNLYLYIYNPSMKDITSFISKVQFATKWSRSTDGVVNAKDYKKFNLKFLSRSNLGEGTVYKYKVVYKEPDFVYIADGTRRYDISGIELKESQFDSKDYSVGITYTFSGYAKGLSNESQEKSTLSCLCDQLTTITVDVHQVSYLTGNSSLGVGYSNQVNSVYFSLPEDIEKKYGDLYSIKYEYDHYYTSPIIVTDNVTSYNTLLSDVGKKVDPKKWKYAIRDYSFYPDYFGYNLMRYYFHYGWLSSEVKNEFVNPSLKFLTTVFFTDKSCDSIVWDYMDTLINAKELEKYFKEYSASYHTGKTSFGYSMDLFDKEKSNGHIIQTKNINDTFNLQGYNSNHNFIERWLNYGFVDKEDFDSIKDVKYIDRIESEIVFFDDEFSKKYLVDDIHKTEFYEYYKNADSNNENVYLLRYAFAPDYYSKICDATGIEGNFLMAQGNCYLNFDIIQFTFKNEFGEETIIPVVSDPTNGFFNIKVTDPHVDWIDLFQGDEEGGFFTMIAVIIIFIIFIVLFVLACIYIPGFGMGVLNLLGQLWQICLVGLQSFGTSVKNGMGKLTDNLKTKVNTYKAKNKNKKSVSGKKQKYKASNNKSGKTYKKSRSSSKSQKNKYRKQYKKRRY